MQIKTHLIIAILFVLTSSQISYASCKSTKHTFQDGVEGNTIHIDPGVSGHISTPSEKIDHVAIIESAKSGDTEEVECLVKSGVDPNSQDDNGITALMVAAFYGHTGTVKFLIDAKANLNLQDKAGYTALMLTSISGFVDITTILINGGADLDLQDNNGLTALMHAIISMPANDTANVLVDAGAES